jgi:hypothetical protein
VDKKLRSNERRIIFMSRGMKTVQIYNDEALEWFDKQPNKTKYIADLIIKDKEEHERNLTRSEIENIVINILNKVLKEIEVVDNKLTIKKKEKPYTGIEVIENTDFLIPPTLEQCGATYIRDIYKSDASYTGKERL